MRFGEGVDPRVDARAQRMGHRPGHAGSSASTASVASRCGIVGDHVGDPAYLAFGLVEPGEVVGFVVAVSATARTPAARPSTAAKTGVLPSPEMPAAAGARESVSMSVSPSSRAVPTRTVWPFTVAYQTEAWTQVGVSTFRTRKTRPGWALPLSARLAERHDLVLAWTSALARAFPRIPLLRGGRREVARPVELCADDAAAARTDRLTVAEGLLTVASGRTPHAGARGGARRRGRHRRPASAAPDRPAPAIGSGSDRGRVPRRRRGARPPGTCFWPRRGWPPRSG